MDQVAALGASDVDGDGFLVPVDTQKVCAFLGGGRGGVDVFSERWAPSAGVVSTLWVLDLDHLRAILVYVRRTIDSKS